LLIIEARKKEVVDKTLWSQPVSFIRSSLHLALRSLLFFGMMNRATSVAAGLDKSIELPLILDIMCMMANVDKVFSGLRRSILHDLKLHAESEYRRGAEKYVKEGIVLYGVRVQRVRKISAKYYRDIGEHGKDYIFALCGRLLRSQYAEEKTIAFDWAYRLRKQYEPTDFNLFQSWLERYVSNWGACDDFCRHAFGAFIYQHPQFLSNVFEWTSSKNRWLRRGAGVIMIYSLRKGEHLEFSFEIADALLQDSDYLVQNGFGWMLKDASILFADRVLEYVVNNKKRMPRRALRYAIERFSAQQKSKVMDG
jgi:3-methyladenine DNA glycosylase AlkD